LQNASYRGLCQAENNFWTAAKVAAVLGGKMEGTVRKNSLNRRQLLRCFVASYFEMGHFWDIFLTGIKKALG